MLVLLICALIVWTIGYYAWRYMRELELLPHLDTKAVFITGCDSGFGNGTVFKCLEHGMTVFAACQTEEVGEFLLKVLVLRGNFLHFCWKQTKRAFLDENKQKMRYLGENQQKMRYLGEN